METATTWLMVITAIMAVALFLQGLALVGLWRAMAALSTRVDGLSKELMRTVSVLSGEVGQAVTTIKSVAEGIQTLSGKLVATSEIIYKRVGEMDSFVHELTDAARLEIARIQDAIDTASRQIEETFELLHRGVLSPVREVAAIIRGFRVGLDFIFRRPRGPSNASPQDEEMFIG